MPAAQPAALKLLKGRSPGRDTGGRKVEMGPAFVRDAPEPPEWLDGEALAEWQRVVPEMERLRMLTRVTRSSLTAYCLTWATYVESTGMIAREGMVVDGKMGPHAHPAVAIQRNAGIELRKWASEYGLTPVAAQKVRVPEAEQPDDLLD